MNAEIKKINKVIIKADSERIRVEMELEDGNITNIVVRKGLSDDLTTTAYQSLYLDNLQDLRDLHDAVTRVLADAEHYLGT